MDLGRGQFYAVWPSAAVAEWQDYETRSRKAFDTAFGAGAPAEAKSLGGKLSARAVFGWIGLTEKIIAAEAKIDDHTLEVAKLGIIRNLDRAPLANNFELRLLKVEEVDLVLAWLRLGSDDLTEVVKVPKSLISEIEAAPQKWQSIRNDLGDGLFVDYRRILLGE